MADRSSLNEQEQMQLAVTLFQLNTRVQIVQKETGLPRTRLVKLYREIVGYSSPKGLVPFAADWFLTWANNIHASLFMGFYEQHQGTLGLPRIDALIRSYKLYEEQVILSHQAPLLDFTQAWTLIQMLDDTLTTRPCQRCDAYFVVPVSVSSAPFVCGICKPPSRVKPLKQTVPADSPLYLAYP